MFQPRKDIWLHNLDCSDVRFTFSSNLHLNISSEHVLKLKPLYYNGGISMEDLIQNSVLNREGKKWKQRWAVLRKVSKSKQQEFRCYYLYLYKDAVHSNEKKKKSVVPLDFCGLETCTEFDKAKNVLVLITSSSTIYLSFDKVQVRDKWKELLVDYYGTAVSYAIIIPDKQKIKSGEATLRLYPSFFSIVTEKNYRCLNRWYINDIFHYSYSPTDPSIFSFEIKGTSSKHKGPVVDLSIPNNAEEVSKAFDFIKSQMSNPESSSMTHNDFHGSAMLDELDQARRNVGDKSFIRRVMLRASDRMRKKKRIRAQSDAYRKKSSGFLACNSDHDSSIFSSIDRRPFNRVDVSTDNSNALGMIRTTSAQIPGAYPRSRPKPLAPIEQNKTNQTQGEHEAEEASKVESKKEKIMTKPRSMTTNDIHSYDNTLEVEKPKTSRSAEMIAEKKNNISQPVLKKLSSSTDMLVSKPAAVVSNINMSIPASDKSEISDRHVRTSADSYTSATYNPAMRVLTKGKKGGNPKNKFDVQKTPTPPPRSPVSLGLQASVFEYPSTDDLTGEKFDDSSSLLNEIDREFEKRITLHSVESDDAFFTASAESSPSVYNNNFQSKQSDEPIYRNVEVTRNNSDSNTLNITNPGVTRRTNNYRRGSTKHLSDPLIDKWTEATGDDRTGSSLRSIPFTPTDYVNVKGPQNIHSDDDDSYVNVTSELSKRKKHIPTPLRIKNKNNDFAQYDDQDSIYHAVPGLDGDSAHSSANGSYENVNAGRLNTRMSTEYWNILSPSTSGRIKDSRLNYVLVGKQDTFMHPISPKRHTPKSPIETFDKTNYTTIDANAMVALKKTMDSHAQQREKNAGLKTPK